jgi:pilus assembly protein CpaF
MVSRCGVVSGRRLLGIAGPSPWAKLMTTRPSSVGGDQTNRDLLELVLARDDLAVLDVAQRRLALRDLFAGTVDDGQLGAAVAEVADSIDGFGPLTELMRDPAVSDVLVNGTSKVWVERNGTLSRTGVAFASEGALLRLVDRLLSDSGARCDYSRPIADARLADGSRLHVVLPPLAPDGPLVSIRRFATVRPTLSQLRSWDALDKATETVMSGFVTARRTIAISGATGSGKTTLMNALLGEIPPTERIVTVEEVPELRPRHEHVVSLVARAPNVEGAGAIGLDELVRAALRMRPDRIVVGEVRGSESLAALGAMATGHEGSMVTVHARSPDDALEKLVTLALQAKSGASEGALQRQVTRAIDVVVQLERAADGVRRVVAIEEVE